MQKKIAIVTNWFGKDLKGGAEQQAWQMATRLSEHVDVEVLTTCSQSFHKSWDKNFYKEGTYQEGHFTIKRFLVDKRSRKQIRDFHHIVGRMLSMSPSTFHSGFSPLTEEEEQIYINNNINSQNLLNHLQKNKDHYDQVIFLPYLFPLSIKGSQIMGEKACLQPCLHDEVYAYLRAVQHSFSTCGLVFFNSKGEEILAQKLIGSFVLDKSIVVGEGVEVKDDILTFKDPPLIEGPYLLYLGKRCIEKNVDKLITSFDGFAKNHPSTPWKLVLAGTDPLPILPLSSKVLDLGLVSEDAKTNLLAHCHMVVNMSVNESFSRLIFEGWFAAKPVLVHEDCLATATALKESSFAGSKKEAGWSVASQQDAYLFFCSLDQIQKEEWHLRGQSGLDYAKSIAIWDDVVQRYLKAWQIKQEKKNTSEAIALILSDKKQTYHDMAQAYAEIILQLGYKLQVLAPFVLREHALASFQIDLSDLSPKTKTFLWMGEEPWPDIEQVVARLDGKKILLRKEVPKASQEGRWSIQRSFPTLMSTFKKEDGFANYDAILKQAQHNTLRVAILCTYLTRDLCAFLDQLVQAHKRHGFSFELEFVLFPEQFASESFPDLKPYIKRSLVLSDASSLDLTEAFLGCDSGVIYGDNTFYPWDALILHTAYAVPCLRVSDASHQKNHLPLATYDQQQIDAILKALYALESSEFIRENAVQLLGSYPLYGTYRSSFANHVKEL